MSIKKSFRVYYLLISEGTTEFNIFAYITKDKFRELFENSNIKFSIKVEIINGDQVISQGKLGGAGNIGDFRAKHALIKSYYADQTLFFLLDKDLDDSLDIEKIITAGGDIVQFIEFNSEHLLLKFAGKNPKKPSEFTNLKDFRDYTKAEFLKEFGKKASDLINTDFDLIFANTSYKEISSSFDKLFSTLPN